MTTLVWDTEAVEGWNEVEDFKEYRKRAGISVAVVFDRGRNAWELYTNGDDEKYSLKALHDRLAGADHVVSFNGKGYDNVVLGLALGMAEPPRWKVETDLMQVIRGAVGWSWPKGSWELNAVCLRTLGHGKNDHGHAAPENWRLGRVGQVVTYCWNDVAILDELHRFVTRYRYVIAPDGKAIEVKQ